MLIFRDSEGSCAKYEKCNSEYVSFCCFSLFLTKLQTCCEVIVQYTVSSLIVVIHDNTIGCDIFGHNNWGMEIWYILSLNLRWHVESWALYTQPSTPTSLMLLLIVSSAHNLGSRSISLKTSSANWFRFFLPKHTSCKTGLTSHWIKYCQQLQILSLSQSKEGSLLHQAQKPPPTSSYINF